MLVTAVELVIAKVLHCDILGDFSTVENDGPWTEETANVTVVEKIPSVRAIIE